MGRTRLKGKGKKKEKRGKREKKLTHVEVNLIKVFLEFGKLLEMLFNLLGLKLGHRAGCWCLIEVGGGW